MAPGQVFGAHSAGVPGQGNVGGKEIPSELLSLGVNSQAEKITEGVGKVIEPRPRDVKMELAGPEHLVRLAHRVTVVLQPARSHQGFEVIGSQGLLLPELVKRLLEIEA